MTDLNTFLLDELAHATAQGREVAFHLSNTLTNAIDQVNQSGVILNSMNDGEDFLEFIDNIGHQFHPFNTAKVVAVNAADYAGLDAQQKFIFSHIMDEVVGQSTLIVNDRNGVNRLFIGPVDSFQIFDPLTGFQALTSGTHPLIPNFQLPPGHTWVQPVTHVINHSTNLDDSQSPDPESTEAMVNPEKPAARVPRPPNPFIIYRAAHHKTVSDAHPEASNNEISKKIGRQWQLESDEVRDAYRKKAAEIKAAFMTAHPGYKYQPRKSCEVKRRAKKNVTEGQDIDDGTD